LKEFWVNRRIQLDSETKVSVEEQKIPHQDVLINTYPDNFIPKFSIVMPVHNEGDIITNVVMDVHKKLGNLPDFPFEIILAEDGSNDNTKEVISDLSKKIPLKAILSSKRKGYAGGIKDGLEVVSSPYVIVSDSDGQHRPEDFWSLKKKLDECEHPDSVIISGNRITRADDFHRRIISKTFQKLNSIMFDLPPIIDITSPFKLMNSNVAKSIASECKYMQESFWTEFTVRACNKRIRIIEVPVEHMNRLEGESVVYKKSKIPKIVLNQLRALLHLKQELTGERLLPAILKTRPIKRLISFGLVGASGAAIIMFLMWLFVSVFNSNYILSGAIAIELSIIWAFNLNNRFTFSDKVRNHSRSDWLRRLLKYNLSSLSGEAINLSLLFALTNAGFYYLSSEAIAIVIVFIYNFALSNKWVWKDNRKLF
jgi:dolichol-phosphate mannosyltransferase